MKQLVTAVVEKDGVVWGVGTNWHKDCKRLGSKTGEDYDKCAGCHVFHHAEFLAIFDAKRGEDTLKGANIHLYGHTYACVDCKAAIEKEGLNLIIHA